MENLLFTEKKNVMGICKITVGFISQTLCFFALITCTYASDTLPIFKANSSQGYIVRVYSDLNPIVLNRIHQWQLSIERNNKPVSDANVTLTGGMPNHDHGLPTQPEVTSESEPGRYIVDGIRFHMPGLWQIIINISGTEPLDTATIEFKL
ncbi:MAG: FixH family protein [Gammaproteobacteria bacterium]|nr:FixH family protein [Gammaproteobacteria bacterium]